MSHPAGFAYFGLLAEGIFEFLGPLVLVGIYVVGALAKKWISTRQPNSDEKEQSELQKAVQKRYQEIHQRQTGDSSKQVQPKRYTKQVNPPAYAPKPIKPPTPVRQPAQRTHPVQPVQVQRQQRPVEQQQHSYQRHTRQEPVSVRNQPPKLVQKARVPKSSEAKSPKITDPEHSLVSMLRKPRNLRSAIILKEILDKPLSLRDF